MSILHSSMGVFHVFKIVQMIPKRNHIFLLFIILNNINTFVANVPILHPLKTLETFAGVFREDKMGTLAKNGLKINDLFLHNFKHRPLNG